MTSGPGPYGPLLERGITSAVLEQAGVTLVRRYDYPYWRYPVRDAAGVTMGWRYKRCGDDDAGQRPKYAWGTEELPSCADAVYNSGVMVAGHPVALCAGEPDVWLASTLGQRACTFLAGEGAAPQGALDALLARRPRHVVVLYDNDAAGHAGAVQVVRRLRDRGMKALARRLPEEVGPGGDLTDLYRLCGYERTRFLATVRGLPCLAIPLTSAAPQPRVPADLPAYRTQSASPIERFKAEYPLADVIEASGVALKPHQGGAYLTAHCPFHHPDRQPSFVVWPQIARWKCYGCGLSGDVLDYGRMYAGETGRRNVAS